MNYRDKLYYELSDFLENPNIKPIKIYTPKEESMDIIKRYKKANMSEIDNAAIGLGVINSDGTLTEDGRKLLLEVLFQDKEIKAKFDKAVDTITETELFE